MAEYSIFMQYDPQDKIYVASVPELQGCMAHGETKEEALKEIEIAKELWIETALEDGLPIPEPALFTSVAVQMEVVKITVSKAQQKATKEWEKRNYDSVNLRLPKGTKERIKNVSETVNGFIVAATLEKLEKEESEEK